MARKTEYVYEEVNNEEGKFINPYTFVEVKTTKGKDKYDRRTLDKEKLFTGQIKCSIRTVSPIAIPDTAEARVDTECKEHYIYPFMKNPSGNYMIPGSSVRGVIRNVYETLTDSCFCTAKEDELLSTRTSADKALKPGLLVKEKGEWVLYKQDKHSLYNAVEEKLHSNGERFIVCGNKEYFSGDKVYYCDKKYRDTNSNKPKKKVEISNKPTEKQGILVIGEEKCGEDDKNKEVKYESIFTYKKNRDKENRTENISKAVELLLETIEAYRKNRTKDEYKSYAACYKMLKGEAGKRVEVPIWYHIDKTTQKLYLSPAAIGRVTTYKTLGDIIGERKPCKTGTNCCPACMLFGLIKDSKDKNNISAASRIRFTDGICYDQTKTTTLTLEELSSPKIMYMRFYSFNSTDGYGYDNSASIRGRKFYWHSSNWAEINKNIDKTERNSTVDVIGTEKESAKFDFSVYYDGITETELKRLIYCLNLGDNNPNGEQCHKIGHGKSVGLGSVKIVVEDVIVREYDKAKEYKVYSALEKYIGDNQEENDELIDKEIKSQLAIVSRKQKNQIVRYPKIINKTIREEIDDNLIASHKWFSNNERELPRLSDKNQVLRFMEVKKQEKGKGNKSFGNNSKKNSGNNSNYNKNNYNKGNNRGVLDKKEKESFGTSISEMLKNFNSQK